MTKDSNRKKAARAYMAEHGVNYMTARAEIEKLWGPKKPKPAPEPVTPTEGLFSHRASGANG